MNNGKATFPEFHNMYIDPVSWAYWKTNGKFPDGTLIMKELVSDGSKQASSGNGYFQGNYNGLEASLKSKKQFPDTPGNWGFFRLTIEDSQKLRKTAKAQPGKNCSACHQANATTDQVFTQYQPCTSGSSK
ncbi:MAG: cytochrome P460 family protein [Methylococcaceae bacterium]